MLPAIPPGARVLIVGGGSGWILEAIASFQGIGLKITYVDASVKMIDLARQRDAGNNEVLFMNAYVEEANLGGPFDIVFTPFLFDNFSAEHSRKIFSVLDERLHERGAWLYCDFTNNGRWWHKFLLKLMYLFFRIISRVEASRIPDMAGCFDKNGYHAQKEWQYMDGFIVSQVYKRA